MAKTIGSFDLASLKNLRDDVTQYFWFESNSSSAWGSGVHVTLYPESQFTDSTSQNYMKGQNIIMNTDGFSIRHGGLPIMVLDNDSLDFNAVDTSAGTYTTMATFGLTGATIGQTSGAHSVIDVNGQRFYASDGTTQLANIGYGLGTDESGTAMAPYYTIGHRSSGEGSIPVSNYSSSSTYKVGDLCKYNGVLYRCKTAITTAEAWNSSHWMVPIGNYSVAEGHWTIASDYASHAEGRSTIASGYASHAEGGNMGAPANGPIASGMCSHAEGGATLASAVCTHAEGSGTQATNNDAHAEGSDTTASGMYSHSQNRGTIANGDAQTALGKYNVADTTNAVIIGNGTAYNARSNALTIDWNGNVTPSGQVRTSFKSSVAMGSYGSSQTTVPNLVEEVRFSSGCSGSASIGTAYTKSGVTIATGWYNFMYMPHRSGGVNGSASGDNCNYGNLFLFGMNNTNGRFVVRVSSSSITEVVKLLTTKETTDYVVEQGTNYRKWNSGLAECWGTATNGSGGSCSVTFPLTFTATPVCVASCGYMSSGTYVAPTVSVQPSTTGSNFYTRVGTTIATQAYTINYEAKGSWK